MVIVLIIVVFVVMASEIARAVPWIFESVVIWGIVAIGTVYTKTGNWRGNEPHASLFAARRRISIFG
jgi:hypothetical protein